LRHHRSENRERYAPAEDFLLGSLALGLAFLRAGDAIETDTFRVLVVKDFDGVAVEDGDDVGGEVGGKRRGIGRRFREDWIQ
jgi:hypothetical protein